MIQAKNKIYIGSSSKGYLIEEMIGTIYDFLISTQMYEIAKAKPRKIKDNYLLEIEINEQTKELLK